MVNLVCIGDIFEAIASKDEQTLVRAVERSSIETMLLFESTYGISPLVHCVQAGDVSHLGLVRCLLTSGLCDSEAVDSKGRTALASLALAQTDRTTIDFLERIIEIVIEGADDTTACYRMLKHNSRKLFEVFLSIKQYDEGRLFEALASALTKLKVKMFALSEDLQLFVLFKLADYGYRHLSGDAETSQCAVGDWKDHIDVIIDCWQVMGEQYDTGRCTDMDNRLLHRLHVMHNQLYFLQHKKFLYYLPIREAIFCVAMLWNVFIDPVNFAVYRLLVNKRLVMEFIRMIASQLAKAKAYLVQVEQELARIVREMEHLSIERTETFFEELMERMKISCNATTIQKYEEKWNATGATNSNRNALMKTMLKRVRKTDAQWADSKMHEIAALQQSQKEWLIVQLHNRLERVEQPEAVADRIVGESKRNQVDTIVAKNASEMFDLEHLMRGKERRIRRKLFKSYDQLKQLYSMKKIIKSLEHIARGDPLNDETSRDCLKRTVMVLGETLKNTDSTPNMPNGRLEAAMYRMLSRRFTGIVVSLRDSYAHALSLSRLMIENEMEQHVYGMLPDHTVALRMVIFLLFVIVLADVRRSFYGKLIQCDSLESLRSLLIYAGEEDPLLQLQHEAFRFVKDNFGNVKNLLSEMYEKPIGRTAEFAHLQQQFQLQCEIVEQVETMLATEKEINFESVRHSCFSCNDIATIRRLLHWKVDAYRPNAILDSICSKWNANAMSVSSIHWMDTRLTWINPDNISSKLAILQCAITDADAFYNINHTRKLIQELGLEDAVNEQAVNHLNEMLCPYYRNIFFLDNKWKVLTSFCKQRRLPWDSSLVRELRQRDQDQLQQLFDGKRSKLRTILALHGIQKGDSLHVEDINIHEDMLASVELLQLEICEILIAVGYFGDSFHYIKQRIPMIQGRNYRNLLAHDSLSYNLLTYSGDTKKIVNAFIFANTEVRLFGFKRNVPIELHLPSLADMYRWVEEQQRLLTSFRSDDVKLVHEMIQSGGEINSYFCFSPNSEHFPATCLLIGNTAQGLAELGPSIVPLLGRYFPYLHELYHFPWFVIMRAIVHRDFEAAFRLIDVNGPFWKQYRPCSWPKLMVRLSTTVKTSMTLAERRDLLGQFLDHGNEECIREMFLQYPDFAVTMIDPDTVCRAILRRLRSTVNLFLHSANRWDPKILEMLAILHWNDLLIDDVIESSDIEDSVIATILQVSLKANNEKALLHFLRKTPCTTTTLAECYLTAATLGRCTILKHMLDFYPTTDRTILSTAIHKAALNKRWSCVRLLLDTGASVDELIPGYQDEDANVLLILVVNEQVKLIKQVTTINRTIYGTSTPHPLAVAVRNETDSDRMVQALKAHGFDWHDSSTILHEIIMQGYDHPVWSTIWGKIDGELSLYRFTIDCDRYTLHIFLLHRWKLIAFVEECKMEQTSLCCAAESEDDHVVRELLNRAYSMRQLSDVGVLGDIVFLKDSTFVHYYKNPSNCAWSMKLCCGEMISRLENLVSRNGAKNWQELQLLVAGVSIDIAVLEGTQVPRDAVFELRDSTSLQDNLQDVLTITDTFKPSQTVVFGRFSLGQRTIHFLRVENTACAYDIFPPDSDINISNTLNIKVAEEDTALSKIIMHQFDLETVKLFVQNGANPLLPDMNGNTPISTAINKHPEAALYLIEECIERDLRNADGLSILEANDLTDDNKLIHIAASSGNQTAIARLLELNVDVTVQNVYGYTPAHIAAIVPRVNTIALMKQLLDYDRTPVDMDDKMWNGGTLLTWAAKNGSIQMLDLIMKYEPNLTLPANRRSLYEAIQRRHVEWAKRFLQHAIEAGVQDVIKMEDPKDDIVVMSLRCKNFELSKTLLEYELGHQLKDITVHDRPRIESVLRAASTNAPPRTETVSGACTSNTLPGIETFLRVSTSNTPQVALQANPPFRELGEADQFINFLGNLFTKLEDNSH